MEYKAMFNIGLLGCVLCLLSAFRGSTAFNISRPNNLVAYWGTNPTEDRLRAYCDGSVDAIVIDGLTYQLDSLPSMTLQGSACGDTMFPHSSLTECPGLEADILDCQNKGVAILVSLVANGSEWADSEEIARTYADLLWDLVLGGSGSTRPFGHVSLDGVVSYLDPSWAGTALYGLVDQLSIHSKADGGRYYWMAVIPCYLADSLLGAEMALASLTAIFVDVSAAECSVAHYEDKARWNYAVWDDWALRHSPPNDFKLYFSVMASATWETTKDYANSSRLAQIASDTMTQYPRYFGGFLYADAAYAASNDGFNVQLRHALSTLALPSTSSSSSASISSAPVTTQNPLPSGGSKSHFLHSRLIVGITIPVLIIACTTIATLVYLRRRRRRARRGDEDIRDSTGELIAPYPPPQDDTPDPWVPRVKWVERKSNSSPPGIPRDTLAETVQPLNAVQEQPQVLQNPEGLAALETEIGRVGLTVPALLASLGRLGSPPSGMNGDSMSETATDPPEYS